MPRTVVIHLAIAGVLLPYGVGITSLGMLGAKVRDHEYYGSGQLGRSLNSARDVTLASYAVGLACCVPAIPMLLAGRRWELRVLFSLGLLLAAAIHLVAVFIVYHLYYVWAGGISAWP